MFIDTRLPVLFAPILALCCCSRAPTSLVAGSDRGIDRETVNDLALATCPPAQVLCGGGCVDPKTSRVHCGAAGDCAGENSGASCEPGEVCSNGSCSLSCQPGLVDCGGICVDPKSSPAHCGASGDCAGSNAGASCGLGEVCSAGLCALSCPTGLVICDGICTDPLSSPSHCGASGDCIGSNAGASCQHGEGCRDGTCTTCPAGSISCEGLCIDPQTNPAHCGASADCAGPNAGTACVAGSACVIAKCKTLVQWAPAVIVGPVSNPPPIDDRPDLAVDPNGNALLVWSKVGIGCYELLASRYRSANGTWSAPAKLALAGIREFKVVTDASGNGQVVWVQDGCGNAVVTRRYDAATDTWDPALTLDSTPCERHPRAAMNAQGDVLAVWLQGYNVRARRYSSATGSWEAITSLDSGSGAAEGSPAVALSTAGVGMAVWSRSAASGSPDTVFGSAYAPASGWAAMVVISQLADHFRSPALAMDSSGNALALWSQSAAPQAGVGAARFDAQTALWSAPTAISSVSTTPESPEIGMDLAGNAVSVWVQADDATTAATKSVYGSRYDRSAGKSGGAVMLSDKGMPVADVRVAVEAAGGALALWQQKDTYVTGHLYSSRYDAVVAAWGAPALVQTSPDDQERPVVAASSSGTFMAAWYQLGAAPGVYAAPSL